MAPTVPPASLTHGHEGESQTEPTGGGTELGTGPDSEPEPTILQPVAKGWRFWAVFPALCLATILISFESSVVSTALPVITAVVDSGDNYVWVLNGYLLAQSVVPPYHLDSILS
jgi:hypothetical protein